MDRVQSLSKASPWSFVPSLYFTQGLPLAAVSMLSVVMYSSMGVSNTQMAFWTSLLYLPWVIKPLWSPLVEAWLPKRRWIWSCQAAMAALSLSLAAVLPTPAFFAISIALFYMMALMSATHDIAADGFYILSLSSNDQARFVGIRSTAFRLALVFAQGGLIWVSGALEPHIGITQSWTLTYALLGALLLGLAFWHRLSLPYPTDDTPTDRAPIGPLLRSFFQKEQISWVIAFLLLYRLGEAQLCRLSAPFLLAEPAAGGLGLSVEELGLYMGGLGVGSLLAGGILGGLVLSRWGLERCLIPFWAALNLPNLLYLWLSHSQPESRFLIAACISIEQFGYGLGFSAYMLLMVYVAGSGQWKTSHYALTTGFMALGIMLPGMFSGSIQQSLGYTGFFAWVLVCAFPCLLIILKLKKQPLSHSP